MQEKLPFLEIRKKHLAATGTILLASAFLAVVTFLSVRNTKISAQDFPPVVGRIEGDDLEVVTNTPAGVERDGAPTVVASGSEVTLRSGHALLMLNAGGEVSVCGPARFKLIQSSGSVTLALDYGRVHPSLETSEGLTIYTPTIVATPIAIAGGRRDITLGLQESGEMCMLTARGAMRVEPQFSDQSMIVPQGGTVSLAGGQIESLQADPAACSCDFPRARLETPKSPAPAEHSQPPVEISALAPPVLPQRRRTENLPPPSAAGSEPVYTVLMPPLSFNAASPEPPPAPAAETLLLVREVRLRAAAEFRGHVNPAPEPVAPPYAPPVALAPAEAPPPSAKPSLLDRVRTFFRRLASATDAPCAGAGCSG
jgi:hypothetical protein